MLTPIMLSAEASDLIILDPIGVQNLNLQFEDADYRDFESTAFAVGRIREIPENRSFVSSRIPGKVIEINAFEGDFVEAGDVVAVIESRLPGNPPPGLELIAPASGIVVKSQLYLGKPFEASEELMEIVDRSKLWAEAQVPESLVSKIRVGTQARLRIPALNVTKDSAQVFRFGVRTNASGGTVPVIFELANPNQDLLPNMRVEFQITTDRRDKVLTVPADSVQGDPTMPIVFIQDFDLPNAFIPMSVVLGERNDEYVEIVKGLFPGDRVVTQGSYALRFAGKGSGMSLKEALDAAHGHEHNEDGSEITADQMAKESASSESHEHHDSPANSWLLAYAILSTLLSIGLFQWVWSLKQSSRKQGGEDA